MGNGTVLGGWAGSPAICKLGMALNAKVILFRALGDLCQHRDGQTGSLHRETDLEEQHGPRGQLRRAGCLSPRCEWRHARLHTEAPVTMFSDFIVDAKKDGSHHTLTADPERYEKDTVEALRAVAKGFAAISNK